MAKQIKTISKKHEIFFPKGNNEKVISYACKKPSENLNAKDAMIYLLSFFACILFLKNTSYF